MLAYVIRRLLWVVLLLFVVSALTFVVFFVLPSADPAQLRAGRQPNPELVEQIRHNLGLDRPKIVQYGEYMKDVFLHFDFGYSYQNTISVKEQVFQRLPATISLALGAAVVWLVIGISVGIISAVRSRSLIDRAAMGAALVAFYARLLRSNLIETMGEDYIRTARAKGLSNRRVVFRHGVRSAITPIVTAAGLDIGILLGGAILTESVFNIPGVGRLAYDSIINSDLPMIQGTVLIGTFFIVLMNLVVDVVYAFLDPRVRYA